MGKETLDVLATTASKPGSTCRPLMVVAASLLALAAFALMSKSAEAQTFADAGEPQAFVDSENLAVAQTAGVAAPARDVVVRMRAQVRLRLQARGVPVERMRERVHQRVRERVQARMQALVAPADVVPGDLADDGGPAYGAPEGLEVGPRRTGEVGYATAGNTPAEPVASAAPEPVASVVPEPVAASAGAAVIAEGQTYLGVPYVAGGASPSGTDCSGFTMQVFQQFGISLPDSPAAQMGYGTPVYGPPAAGDLVFFDEHGYGISHVGIAMGDGTVLHSSTYTGAVTVTPMEYLSGYAGARRLL